MNEYQEQTIGVDAVQPEIVHEETVAVVPQEETLAAFDELVQAGKVRHIGCSTHPAWMVMEALAIAARDDRAAYATEQPPYNLVDRRIENELLPLCRKYGLGVLPWSPLARGFLAGNRGRDKTGETTRSRSDEFAHAMYYQDRDFTVVDRVTAVAALVDRARPKLSHPPFKIAFCSSSSIQTQSIGTTAKLCGGSPR